MWDLRFRIADFVAKAQRVDSGIRMWECGLRPLRAVGSIYEPEAGGAIEAYAPEGRWNEIYGTQIFTDNHGLYFSAGAGKNSKKLIRV